MSCTFIITSGAGKGKQCPRKYRDERVPYCTLHLRSDNIKSKLIKSGVPESLIKEVSTTQNIPMFRKAMESASLKVVEIDSDKTQEVEHDDVVPESQDEVDLGSCLARMMVGMIADDLELVVPGSRDSIVNHEVVPEFVRHVRTELNNTIDFENLPPMIKLCFDVVNKVISERNQK